MRSNSSRALAWLIAVMLASGVCCCRTLEAAAPPTGEHSCCGKKESQPAHDHCSCAKQVLSEAKSAPVALTPAAAPPVFALPAEAAFFHAPRLVGHPLRAVAHAPPPRDRQRLLQVWLI